MNVLSSPYLTVLCRLIVGGVFVSYGVDKIIAPKDFAHSIMNYEMMPHSWVNIMALIMPWVEVLAGLTFIFGIRIKASALILSGLLVTFIMAISVAMARGLEINCGCSAHAEPVGIKKILEDGAYLALSLLVYLRPNALWSVDSYIMKQHIRHDADHSGVEALSL